MRAAKLRRKPLALPRKWCCSLVALYQNNWVFRWFDESLHLLEKRKKRSIGLPLKQGSILSSFEGRLYLLIHPKKEHKYDDRTLARPVTDLDEQLQWGWDKLAVLCYLQGVQPPRHLPDLVDWLHQPVESWEGIGQFFEQADLVGSLLCFGMPSEFCMTLGRDMHLSDDPERELQDTPFKEIMEYCKSHHLVDQYREARKFLVKHPYCKL